jgi:hypothetical protein
VGFGTRTVELKYSDGQLRPIVDRTAGRNAAPESDSLRRKKGRDLADTITRREVR